jgi:hypothetical protein
MMDLGAREPETGETGGEETGPHFPLVTYPPPFVRHHSLFSKVKVT